MTRSSTRYPVDAYWYWYNTLGRRSYTFSRTTVLHNVTVLHNKPGQWLCVMYPRVLCVKVEQWLSIVIIHNHKVNIYIFERKSFGIKSFQWPPAVTCGRSLVEGIAQYPIAVFHHPLPTLTTTKPLSLKKWSENTIFVSDGNVHCVEHMHNIPSTSQLEINSVMLSGTFPPGCSQIHILLRFSRKSAPCQDRGLNPGTMFTDMDRIAASVGTTN